MDAFGNVQPKIVPLETSEDQFQTYNRISRNYSRSFLFESLTGPGELAETSIMGFDPAAIFRGYSDRVEVEYRDGKTKTVQTRRPLAELRRMLGRQGQEQYRYMGGAVGAINYDAIRLVEDIPQSNPAPEPLMEFGMYDDGIIYDNAQEHPVYFYRGQSRLDELESATGKLGAVDVIEGEPGTDRAAFEAMVGKAQQYIRDGDVFQLVLSRKFPFTVRGDSLSIYRRLRELNPSPYMYHLKQGVKTVIGASPEMLVRVTGDAVETFPIAGTRKVTGDETLDKMLADELRCDEKELAEHTMLVDLGRNDIGRVCRYGTVRVNELMEVRRFSHVQHMVTHVEGTLDERRDMFDAFDAVFPAGTVTGAPKVRAMEIIDELECEPRGPYAGAVGYFSYNACCDFAIAIRSIFIDGERGFVQSGAGIVSDSVPYEEFRETQYKADAMIQSLREAGI